MKWLYGLLCLIFLIIFHEFGHFIAAKLFGVKVESFSVGFGPILFHKKIKGTDYRLSLIPLGGYCGMKGEKDFQKAIEEKLPSISAEPDSLYGVHPFKRALIGFAGPFFNFIFAIIAFSLINGIGYSYKTYSNQILINDEVTSTVAKDAGLLSGDKIIKINNKNTYDFFDLQEEIAVRPDEDIKLTIDRNGQILEFVIHTELEKSTGSGKIGIAADTSIILTKDSPKYGFFGAIGHGFLDAINNIKITLKSIKILFKGVNLNTAVSGPARVTEMLGATVQEGFSAGFKTGIISLFSFLGLISVSLFMMNLLPIPVLDGGLILIALIEIIIRRRINPRVQYYVQYIGLAFIAIIFIIAIKGDISFFINRGK
ncbi:MAG: site-2 protease family protein [Treponema sp.]|nr:site-2 protease family protein [Treponema sp.]